ncbi:enoyl-CoA hydratase [Nostoc sp. 3335mG]|nr:enoyl-CoA hydratase [Nostoc sp. 3335mG]
MANAVLPAIRLERDGNLGVITLARPEVANAVNRAFAQSFKDIVAECNFDRTIGAVLIRAEGGLFCAGADREAFAGAGARLPYLIRDITADFHAGLIRLAHMRKPVVTAVQGATAGAGFGLALAGDIVVAARSASLALNYPAMGLSPDAGTTWLLPRLVGVRKAQEMALLNTRLSADEALSLGLITRVVEDETLEAASLEIARTLAAGPTRALGAARALIIEGLGKSYDEQLQAEARSMIETARDDGPEADAAIYGARTPTLSSAA